MAAAVAAAPVSDGDDVAAVPPSPEPPRVSATDSADGAPAARAVSGSQNTVIMPSAVSKINVAVTTAEVRSGRAAGAGDVDGLVFGVAGIGRNINTS
ncbi:MAG TPA: hypothetical protein VG319_10120 [Polyangia bacterium]|nr:hypothetical protein [Polyangia bacterium]